MVAGRRTSSFLSGASVNRRVAGPSPARGARFLSITDRDQRLRRRRCYARFCAHPRLTGSSTIRRRASRHRGHRVRRAVRFAHRATTRNCARRSAAYDDHTPAQPQPIAARPPPGPVHASRIAAHAAPMPAHDYRSPVRPDRTPDRRGGKPAQTARPLNHRTRSPVHPNRSADRSATQLPCSLILAASVKTYGAAEMGVRPRQDGCTAHTRWLHGLQSWVPTRTRWIIPDSKTPDRQP